MSTLEGTEGHILKVKKLRVEFMWIICGDVEKKGQLTGCKGQLLRNRLMPDNG